MPGEANAFPPCSQRRGQAAGVEVHLRSRRHAHHATPTLRVVLHPMGSLPCAFSNSPLRMRLYAPECCQSLKRCAMPG